ncbi:hypothetical protein Pmani_039496 [Petrolisthes manimaculis]|uniref:Uncharacterized protein n=1 Tax=Petrolisthes manimaculis TaxID=1843537 RepID=A0AAE1TJ83_9EUCA|nr:hypothetical protein Pmani_039496 [Petrolisthes manimaculis]
MACNDAASGKVGLLYPGFLKADDRNLPRVDLFMLVDFFRRLQHPTMKQVKLQRSTGEDYGDDAVGYVQLKRASGICEVTARITPEHKTTSKPLVSEEDADCWTFILLAALIGLGTNLT